MNRIEELKALAELHANGVLTDEEFQQQKSRLLAAVEAQPQPSESDPWRKRYPDEPSPSHVTRGMNSDRFASSLSIFSCLAILSMFMPWLRFTDGWDVAKMARQFDSSLLYLLYLFPFGALCVFVQHIRGFRASGICFLAGLIPLLFPFFIIMNVLTSDALDHAAPFSQSFEIYVDFVLEHSHFGFKAAVISGFVMFCHGMFGRDEWRNLARESESRQR